ncbi:MAG: TonB family protein [Candidatus Acidiferrales bacterium]
MEPSAHSAREPVPNLPVEPPHARSSSFDLSVRWESPWREFWSSLRDSFTTPRPAKGSAVPGDTVLRVEWVRGKLPGRAFAASCLWHVAAVLILALPIWSFLPEPKTTLAPVQIQVEWYTPPEDLPRISLRAPALKSKPVSQPEDASKPVEQHAADTFNPRQTIISIPVHVTHPRQTLIEPDAPPTPPKIVPQLPNIVQWAATAPARPQLQISPTAAAPRIEQHTVRDVAAPEVANNEKNPGPLNIAPAASANPQLRMPLQPMSAPAAQRNSARTDAVAAPEIGSADSAGDTSLRRLIALSATPGPPAPDMAVPQGNLAARISMSPNGTKPGAAGGMDNRATGTGSGSSANSISASGTGNAGAAGGNGNFPASVSISGGIVPAARRPGNLDLGPTLSAADLGAPRSGPSVVGAIDPSLAPEKILSGKEVYTLHVNMPNFTSSAGSWIMDFAQLNEEDPRSRPKGQLAAPVPLEKVDPQYPQAAIRENVDGQVILYAIIRKDGSVDSIQLVHSIDPRLDHNAMEALARWKFQPATRDSVPVDVEAVVYIPFRFRAPLP